MLSEQMDNFLLQAVVDELKPILTGRRLVKVYQPSDTDLALDFQLGSGKSLIVSIGPAGPAAFLGQRTVDDASKGKPLPPFALRLRKQLGSSTLVNIEKLGDDRVIDLDFRIYNDSSQHSVRRLTLSLVGKSADVFLVEDSDVVDSLRKGEHARGPYRRPLPVTDRIDPLTIPDDTWQQLVAQAEGDVARAAARLLGLTPVLCRELAWLARDVSPVVALRELCDRMTAHPARPGIYSAVELAELMRRPGLVDDSLTLSNISLDHLAGLPLARFASVNEAAEAYFKLVTERQHFSALKQRLNANLRQRLKKQQRLRENLEEELTKFQQEPVLQRFGDLLLANINSAVKAGDDFLVTDYFTAEQPQVSVPTAAQPDAQSAAAHYFKAARKARNGLIAVRERISQTDAEVTKLQRSLLDADHAANIEDVTVMLKQAGLSGSDTRSRKDAARAEAKQRLPGIRRYRSADGYEILVGRSERDNDHLTMRIARSSDLWFHAADYPGSHVVLRNPSRKTIAPGSIIAAAQLAAKFSQAAAENKVAVNYCERKFVSKPKGFSPGQVRLSSFKTIIVEPAEAAERLY